MMNGLPSDTVSQENSIYSTKGSRWPLLIDPQFQANKWIKNMEAKNGLRLLNFKDTRFSNDMRACVMQGIPVLIQAIF